MRSVPQIIYFFLLFALRVDKLPPKCFADPTDNSGARRLCRPRHHPPRRIVSRGMYHILCQVTSCDVVSFHVSLCYMAQYVCYLCCVVLTFVALCFVMFCLCCVMFCFVVLCYFLFLLCYSLL